MNVKYIKINKLSYFVVASFAILQTIYCFLPHPMISMGDEVVYSQIARDIFDLQPVSTFHYPFIYPLVLSVGYLAGENFYDAFIIINILCKTVMLMVIIRMLDGLVSEKSKFWVILMIAACPIVFFWSKYIMSENIMALLLVISVLFYIKNEGSDSWRKTIIAAMLGLMLYWTKYLAFVLLPIFFLYWCGYFKLLNVKTYAKENAAITVNDIFHKSIIYIVTLFAAITGYALIWCKWSMQPFTFDVLKDSMGFLTGSGPEQSGYFLMPEARWIIAYLCYAIMLVLLPASAFFYRKYHYERKNVFTFILLIALTLIFVAARHSTFGGEIDGRMFKLVARYVEYLPLLVIIAWSVIADRENMTHPVNIRVLRSGGVFYAP